MTDKEIRFEDYQRLIFKLCRKHHRRLQSAGVEFQDLVQEASLVFVIARQKFDPTRGVKFSTYLWRAVENALSRTLDGIAYQTRNVGHSLDEEKVEGATLHDAIASDAEAGEDATLRRDTARRNLERLSPDARLLVLLMEQPTPALADQLRRRRAFARECSERGYAAGAVKLSPRFIADALGWDTKRRAAALERIRIVTERNDAQAV